MVPFTIWSSQHSPQTLLMLYRRTAGMTSTAGCATARARCSAVSSAPGCTTPSASNYQPSPRATGSVQSVRYLAEDVCMCVCTQVIVVLRAQNLLALFTMVASDSRARSTQRRGSKSMFKKNQIKQNVGSSWHVAWHHLQAKSTHFKSERC